MDAEGTPQPTAPPPQMDTASYPERQVSFPSEQQPADQPSLTAEPPPSYGDVADQRYSFVPRSEKNVEHMQQATPQYPPQQPPAGYPMQQPQPAYPIQQPQPAYPIQQPAYPMQQPPQPAYQQPQQQYYANPPSYYPGGQQQQQQQQNVVVVQQPRVVQTTVQHQAYAGNYGQNALVLAIVITFCFAFFGCWPLLICSILAIVFASNANSASSRGDTSSAASNTKTSYGLSVAAITLSAMGVVALVIYIIVIIAL